MNKPASRNQTLLANLEQLKERVPELPISAVLLSRLILHLGRGIAGLMEQEIRPFGLVEAEFRVLTTLFAQPDGVAHPGELCARTAQSPANMSRIGDALVGRGFITRVPSSSDRRKLVLHITERGEDLVRGLLPTLYEPLREMFEELSDAEQQRLTAELTRLTAKLEGKLLPERSA